LSRFLRTISQSVSALAVLSLVCTGVAAANPTATVTAPTSDTAAPATTVATAGSTTATAPASADDVAQTGPLADVPTGHWAYDAVAQLVKDGLIKGYPDGTYKGARPMTRYEVAVLAYRAVDQIEAQITAGKAVTQADIDAANKLIAAFGKELKSVEQHVDALQRQADSTKALADATAATVRKQQLHFTFYERAMNYNQSIQANNGPLPITAAGLTIAPGQAIPFTGSVSSTTTFGPVQPGIKAGSYSGALGYGNQPMPVMPQNSNAVGNLNHGLGMSYASIVFGGNPDDRSQYLIKLTNTFRYDATNFLAATTPAYCTNAGAGATAVSGATCTGGNAGPADADGVISSLVRLQELWYQYTTPGGFYAKVGKFQEDEGPKQVIGSSWQMTDILDGARIGWRNAYFNAQVVYGFDDSSATQNLLYGIPASQQLLSGEADVQLDKGRTDIGVTFQNYTGFHQVLWDPYAINCVGNGSNAAVAVGATKVLPYTASQVYLAGQCGAGYAPVAFGANAGGYAGPNAGLPITGAYVTAGAGAAYPNTNLIGGFTVLNYGKVRAVFEGTAKLGNDPFTGVGWKDNLSGFFQIDYGPYLAGPGVRGKTTFETGGYAVGFNGLAPPQGYYAGPAYWSNVTTDPSGYFFGWIGAKYFLTDSASFGIWLAHLGLLPNEILPAGSASCPGCAVTGDSRNLIIGELNLAF
jgi:hypothetical protein